MPDETYRLMCSHPEIQGMWQVEVGDKYWDEWNGWEGIWLGEDAFSKERGVEGLTWLPREGDWMRLLADYFPRWRSFTQGKWHCVSIWDSQNQKFIRFTNSEILNTLCQAFMWTKGWRWEGKWERRER